MSNQSILFILKKKLIYDTNSYSEGLQSGLVNSAIFASKMLNDSGVESNLVEVIDNNCIDKEVSIYQPTHVIIEALWVVPEKFEILSKLYPNVHWIIRLHSEIPFIANEGNAIEWIHEYSILSKRINLSIAPNTSKMFSDLDALGIKNLIMLPNYYPVICKPLQKFEEKSYVDVGCFGAIRPLKNQLLQAVAAIKFGNFINKPIKFHINAGRVENGNSVLENIRAMFKNQEYHELVEHGWYNHEDFIVLVNQMDLGLQVSMNETFNIVAADFVTANIPLIGSTEITWLSYLYKALTTSSDDIFYRMVLAYKFRDTNIQKLNKNKLHEFVLRSKNIWVNYFK